MKLRRELVERIASRLAAALLAEKQVRGLERANLASRIQAAMTDDLRVEDRLNDEVREILRQHIQELDRSHVEFHEMFKKVKAKLVRDRKLIL
ncbi:MAG: DUF507 family protein [Acidobacteriota bacterium]